MEALELSESFDATKLLGVPRHFFPPGASARRRSSVDTLSRSRRGSADMAARLEVDLRSHVFRQASRSAAASPAPFAPCFSGDISEDVEAHIDDKLTIACHVHGHPRPEVAWNKDGVLLLQNSHGVELWSRGFEHKLVIPYVGHEHAGTYCIAAVNQLGRSECHFVLHVIDESAPQPVLQPSPALLPTDSSVSIDTPPPLMSPPATPRGCCTAGCQVPPELLQLFRDLRCRTGDPVVLECEVAGSPAARVTWSFNGQPIRAGHGRFRASSHGDRHRLLLTDGATLADAGRICLVAENAAGVASCGALLIVEDPATGKVCNQKVIRAATKYCNRRPAKPSEEWQSTPSYSLVT